MLELKTPTQARSEINDIFVDLRKPEEIDMVGKVREILIAAGLATECSSGYDTNRYIQDAAVIGPVGQRFLLNRFWNLQLMNIQDTNTMEERFCLIDNGSPEDWLRLFQTKVIPCLVKHRLPKVL